MFILIIMIYEIPTRIELNLYTTEQLLYLHLTFSNLASPVSTIRFKQFKLLMSNTNA